MAGKRYWLVKSEPSVYSLEQLRMDGSTLWTGVRNYQARNFLKEMQVGDLLLYYHSNDEPIGVFGIAKVLKTAEPDPTQFDKSSEYYDSKSTRDNPRWFCPTVGFVEAFCREIKRADLQECKELKNMILLQRGSRLSVQPVTGDEFDFIVSLGRSE